MVDMKNKKVPVISESAVDVDIPSAACINTLANISQEVVFATDALGQARLKEATIRDALREARRAVLDAEIRLDVARVMLDVRIEHRLSTGTV